MSTGDAVVPTSRPGKTAAEPVTRRLAAIIAADVAGYSRLMGLDEVGTAEALREHRAAVDPIVAQFGGRVVKTTGDGVLLEFPSVVAAVECAVAVQKLMAERNAEVAKDQRMLFRLGINVGDVLVQDDDILGDGVNVAARLEGIADPGGICVSDDVYRQVAGKLDVAFEDAGEQQLKNIVRPVRVYRAHVGEIIAGKSSVGLPLPDKPSIAVLPFLNMSGDPEQDYFADGIVEDITTALSRFKQLFVIARNSTFTYKGKSVDVKQAGRELGVRYVLEGSVRKAKDRLRITAQLIDTTTSAHLWADRFEGPLTDIFALQDEVTERIVGALDPTLDKEQIERARKTTSIDAVTEFYRGLPEVYGPPTNRETNEEALQHFRNAMSIDPNFTLPYGGVAFCLLWRRLMLWSFDIAAENAELLRLVERVRRLGADDAFTLCGLSVAVAWNVKDLDLASELAQQALQANPNFGFAYSCNGFVKAWRGESDTAIADLERGMRMSPRDPGSYSYFNAIAAAHINAGRYAEAASWSQRALRESPNSALVLRLAVVSYFCAGRFEDARKMMARLRQLVPDLRLSNFDEASPPTAKMALYREALQKMGLPD